MCIRKDQADSRARWYHEALHEGDALAFKLEISRTSYRLFSPFPANHYWLAWLRNSLHKEFQAVPSFESFPKAYVYTKALNVALTNFSCDIWSKEWSEFSLRTLFEIKESACHYSLISSEINDINAIARWNSRQPRTLTQAL